MRLQERWLAFCKKHIDNWMLKFQRDDSVSLKDWQELQEEYKALYGKDYERTN
jgi:type VI protein secretion system component VasK